MLSKALQDTADGLGENRDERHVGIVLLRVRKEQGWRITKGRQGERKRRGITIKCRETKHNDTVSQEKLE